MKRTWLLVAVCGTLFPGGRIGAEEPTTAHLLCPVWLPSFCPPRSLTEPPQVEGLLAGPAPAACPRAVPAPQMIGGASVGLYRFAGNDSALPVNRVFGAFGPAALPAPPAKPGR